MTRLCKVTISDKEDQTGIKTNVNYLAMNDYSMAMMNQVLKSVGGGVFCIELNECQDQMIGYDIKLKDKDLQFIDPRDVVVLLGDGHPVVHVINTSIYLRIMQEYNDNKLYESWMNANAKSDSVYHAIVNSIIDCVNGFSVSEDNKCLVKSL